MKPSSSKLAPFETQSLELRKQGMPLQKIADSLYREHELNITYNAVFSFQQTRKKVAQKPSLFFENLPDDIRDALIRQLTAL